jgi:serine protease Do
MALHKKIIFFLIFQLMMIKSVYSAPNSPNEYGFADLVEKSMPAVVNISTTQKITDKGRLKNLPGFPEGSPFEDFNDLLEKFGMLPGLEGDEKSWSKKAISLGSGFIIDSIGYIVTNHHVIADSEEVTVKLNDNREFKAKVVGSDAKTDLALLKIEAGKDLPYVKFGNSDESRVGEWVIAIGNPFGLEGTATSGIISARARDINAGAFDDFIQTDAAINRGNSGGPMFNMKGEVIGINTAIYSPSGGNVGIGFATPSSLAKPIIEKLKKGIKIKRGWLGIAIQPVTDEVVDSLSLSEKKGALVAGTTKGSPAEKAGLIPGDIIIMFDGKEVLTERKLQRIVADTPVGKKIEIVVIRNNEKKKLTAKVGEAVDKPAKQGDDEEETPKEEPYDGSMEINGITVTKLTPELKETYDIDRTVKGLLVVKVAKKSEWGKRGIYKGDIISAVNQQNITTPEELKKIVKEAKTAGKKSILCLINRNGQTIFMPLPVKE